MRSCRACWTPLARWVGDPHDRATVIGPMISERDAIRAESWVQEAVAQGARLLLGGRRRAR